MSFDISAVREAMRTALDVIPQVNVNAYAMAQPIAPGLQILPPAVEYDKSMARGLDTWMFVIQGFVAFNQDVSAQRLLDTMCAPAGANSVKRALEADSTLGGLVQDASVIDQTPGRLLELPGVSPLLFVEWRVQVWARGD